MQVDADYKELSRMNNPPRPPSKPREPFIASDLQQGKFESFVARFPSATDADLLAQAHRINKAAMTTRLFENRLRNLYRFLIQSLWAFIAACLVLWIISSMQDRRAGASPSTVTSTVLYRLTSAGVLISFLSITILGAALSYGFSQYSRRRFAKLFWGDNGSFSSTLYRDQGQLEADFKAMLERYKKKTDIVRPYAREMQEYREAFSEWHKTLATYADQIATTHCLNIPDEDRDRFYRIMSLPIRKADESTTTGLNVVEAMKHSTCVCNKQGRTDWMPAWYCDCIPSGRIFFHWDVGFSTYYTTLYRTGDISFSLEQEKSHNDMA
jgi:hypothetical protein